MRHSNQEWGGALSTFDEGFGHDGRRVDVSFAYQTLGLSGDFLLHNDRVAAPDYIKIDVDGVEHLILAGASLVLKGAKSVLVEVNDDFEQQRDGCERVLKDAGFSLRSKEIPPLSGSGEFASVSNQIWVRG